MSRRWRTTRTSSSRGISTRLIGPYPAAKEVYRERSPIHFIDRLSCALILFQGLEDKVVPPDQSEMMADAVRAKGLPVAYLAFEGEQHGFRGGDDHPLPGGGAVFLRRGVQVHARGPADADRDRQPALTFAVVQDHAI